MSGVLVVGAGLAGARCAEALRAGGYERPITLVGEERLAPYERPALSKEVLSGGRDGDDLLLRPAGWWGEQGVDLLLGAHVDAVDVARRSALVGGRELRWHELVLATGARPRRLPVLPAPALVLRTLADAHELRERLLPGTRLTVVGAGLIGAEVASTALARGCEVTLLDAAPVPLVAAVGAEVGELLARRWRARGATLRLDARITRADEHALELADGTAIGHDVLLVAVGAAPEGRPLAEGGVPTDACGRTQWRHVYACGDAAAFDGSPAGHWTAAAGQATAVARAILGSPEPYGDVPYFWSDQFGLRLQMVGDHADAAAVELDGDDDAFAARYVDADGRVLATLLANRPAGVAAARRELQAA